MIPAVASEPADPDPFGRRAYYLHIHKAAGITMRRILSSMYAHHQVCPAERYQEWLATPDTDRYRLFSGHFGLRPIERYPDLALLTTVRDPVARSLSQYHQIRRFPGHSMHEVVTVAAPTFEEFVRHPEGRARLPNLQARMLAGSPSPDQNVAAVEMPHDELAERAIARLDSCVWVGIVERLDDCLLTLARQTGHPAPREAAAANHAPAPTDTDALDDATRALVEEMTQVDAVVYEHARLRTERDLDATVDAWFQERGRLQLASHSAPLDGELVVDFADPMVSAGFVDRTSIEGIGVVRWIEAEAPAWLDVTRWFGPGTNVAVRFVGEVPEHTEQVDLRIDDEQIGGALRDEADGTWYEGAVTALHGPVSRIQVTCRGGVRAVAGVRLRLDA